MSEKLIKTITVGEDVGRVDYNSLANLPEDKSEEIEALKLKCTLLEDRFATELYPTYPQLTFNTQENVTNIRVLKGNIEDADIIPLFGRNVVVAYHKDGIGYADSTAVDAEGKSGAAQFNLLVDVIEGKVAVAQPDHTGSEYFNKLEVTREGIEGNTYRIKATKVAKSFGLNILATIPVEVTWDNYAEVTLEDNNKGEMPTKANDLADLLFKVNHGGKAGRPENGWLTKAIINDVEVSIGTEEGCIVKLTNAGANKDSYTIAKENIQGDIHLVFGNAPVTE